MMRLDLMLLWIRANLIFFGFFIGVPSRMEFC